MCTLNDYLGSELELGKRSTLVKLLRGLHRLILGYPYSKAIIPRVSKANISTCNYYTILFFSVFCGPGFDILPVHIVHLTYPIALRLLHSNNTTARCKASHFSLDKRKQRANDHRNHSTQLQATVIDINWYCRSLPPPLEHQHPLNNSGTFFVELVNSSPFHQAGLDWLSGYV